MLPSYDEALKDAEVGLQQRRDVVTIAQEVRAGAMGCTVQPVSNGFIVSVGYDSTIVCTKANDVGLLIRTLYSSDLENEGVLKRLRRLMGYK
jgi:hypothetical protein